jgi:hypothetical protein
MGSQSAHTRRSTVNEDQPIIPNRILDEIDELIQNETPEDAVDSLNEMLARMAATSSEDAEAVARVAMVRLKAAGWRAKLTLPQPPLEVRVVSLPDRFSERVVTRDERGVISGMTDLSRDV